MLTYSTSSFTLIRYLLFHSPVDQSSSLQLQESLQFLYVNWNYIPCVYYNPCPVEFQITREVEVSSGIVLDTVLGNSSRLGFLIHECFGKRRSLGSIPSPNLLPSLRRLDRLYGAQAIDTGPGPWASVESCPVHNEFDSTVCDYLRRRLTRFQDLSLTNEGE